MLVDNKKLYKFIIPTLILKISFKNEDDLVAIVGELYKWGLMTEASLFLFLVFPSNYLYIRENRNLFTKS